MGQDGARLGPRLARRRLFFALLPALACCGCGSGAGPARKPGLRTGAVGVHRHLERRHRRLLHRAHLRRPKLAPTISPNKTISGLIGGLIAATLLGRHLGANQGLHWAGCCLPRVRLCRGAIGDLFESWMKRQAGVKDSGAHPPGPRRRVRPARRLVPVAVLTARRDGGARLMKRIAILGATARSAARPSTSSKPRPSGSR
jgi:hypothetical protein